MSPTTRTLGIDLATRSGVTGVCEVAWGDHAWIMSVAVGSLADDDLVGRITDVVESGGWVAIDAPFGFPRAFSELVGAWHSDRPVARPEPSAPSWLGAKAPWDPVNRRITDGYVHVRLRDVHTVGDPSVPWPLSSVVERITPTVLRCAQLLSQTTTIIDRVGFDSRVVEAYPAAALRLWGFATAGYKGRSGGPARELLLTTIQRDAPWLELNGFEQVLWSSDDALDALICALVARLAAHSDRISGPDASGLDMDLATVAAEGWIHLPPVGHSVGALMP